jgi:hypothetical protein
MIHDIYTPQIRSLLFGLADEVTDANKLNLHDAAINCENLFRDLLNLIYGYNLQNSNQGNLNQNVYDLDDKKKKICIQVTSNKKRKAKIYSTIKQFKDHNLFQKYNRLAVVFITKVCDKKYLNKRNFKGFIYEGYDLSKIVQSIHYLTGQKKKAILEFLSKELGQTVYTSSKAINKNVIADQVKPLRKKGLYIKRKMLLEKVTQFLQNGNCLLCGGPGDGKSFLIEEIYRNTWANKGVCCIIRVNELLKGNDEEIGQEIRIGKDWVEGLASIPGQKSKVKNVLVFDAFDTAKDETLKSEVLWQIKNAIEKLKDNWRVVVSCRTYDAQKSTKLLNLFPEEDLLNPVRCRFLEVPPLTQEEVENELSKDRVVFKIYRACTLGLQQLLKTPFFLKIFELLVSNVHANKKTIEAIETEEQLLKIYWDQKIQADSDKQIFLTQLAEKLCENIKLSCKRTDIINQTNNIIFETLVSEGIVVTTGIQKQNIAFSHNILFDYAIARLLISGDVDLLVKEIERNERLPFLYTPSFIYFYSHVWQNHRTEFWVHYLKIRSIQTPVFRLFLQTVLNSVIVSIYKSESELDPILSKENVEERSLMIKRMLDGLRFINRDKIREQDLKLFYRLSTTIHINFLWELGYFIDKSINSLSESSSKQKLQMVGKSARNYFQYILNERKTSSQKQRLDGCGGYWGILNLTRTFCSNRNESKKLIREVFMILKEPDFWIWYFHSLADQLTNISKIDPKFAVEVYKRIYRHTESSDKETNMGTMVLSLRSNRRQDFEMCYYDLEKFYSEFLVQAPLEAIGLGIFLIDVDLQKLKEAHRLNFTFPFKLFNSNVTIISDYVHHDREDDKEHGLFSHIFKVFQYLQNQVDAKKFDEVNRLVKLICTSAHASQWWRGILKFLSENPKITNKISEKILEQSMLFACDDISYEIGELIRTSWKYFSLAAKKHIEKAILALRENKFVKYDDLEYRERKISVFLGCIPQQQASLSETKEFISEKGIQENKPRRSGVLMRGDPQTREERMIRLGADKNDVTDNLIIDLVERIEKFNSQFDLNKNLTPSASDYTPEIETAKQLFNCCKNIPPSKSGLREYADYEVSRFAKVVSRDVDNLNQKVREIVEEIGFYYFRFKKYIPDTFEVGEGKQFITWGPTARTSAALTLNQLLETDQTGKIADEVSKMVADNSLTVRFKSLSFFTYYWRNRKDFFWNTTFERLNHEPDTTCYTLLLRNVAYSDVMNSDLEKVQQAARIASERVILEDAHSNLMKQYIGLLLRLVIFEKSEIGKSLINEGINYPEFSKAIIFEIFAWINPRREDVNYINDKNLYEDLFKVIHSILSISFLNIEKKGLSDENVKSDFEIIDKVVQQLYFKTKHKKSEKERHLTFEEKKAFFERIKPIIDQLIDGSRKIDTGFMTAHTGYYFIQALNDLLPIEPEYILSVTKSIVDYAAANNFTYDNSVVKEIVELTEQLLANHKSILENPINFKNLLAILDHFANSGWVEALELIWRLKEIF